MAMVGLVVRVIPGYHLLYKITGCVSYRNVIWIGTYMYLSM